MGSIDQSRNYAVQLLPSTAITAAVTNVTTGSITLDTGVAQALQLQAVFTYTSGGTTAKFWVQTTFDGGATWVDIINFAFATASLTKVAAVNVFLAATHATPTDAALADNTINNGLIGEQVRVKYTTTGTYVGTTIAIRANVKG